MSAKAKPAHNIRRRAVAVTIRNNDSGRAAFCSATPGRSYKQGGQWQDRDRFDGRLLPLAKLPDQPLNWIANAGQAELQTA